MRVTVACPAALRDAANHLAMCLAESSADALTFRAPSWRDADGNLYAVASWEASDRWLAAAQAPPVRPEWDAEGLVDMAAAARAHAAQVVSAAPVVARPDALTAIIGMEPHVALAAMSLLPDPEDMP